MANVLTVPASGAIIFDNQTAGSSTISPLSSAPRLQYDNAGGLNITSYTTGTSALDRFTVDGSTGRLFSVSDALTGIIFSVNDISGLPLIEVNSGIDDTITLGAYPTNALVVKNDKVGIGTATPNEKLTVVGNISATGSITVGADNTIVFDTRSTIQSPSNGVITIGNAPTLNDFNRLQLGGTSASFPAIKRNGTGLDITDGTGLTYTSLAAGTFVVNNNIVTRTDDFTLSGADAGKYTRLTKLSGTQTITLTGSDIQTGHEFTFYRATSASLALSGGTVNGGGNISSVPQFGAFALKHLGGGTFDFI
jgi:hypothetical protein